MKIYVLTTHTNFHTKPCMFAVPVHICPLCRQTAESSGCNLCVCVVLQNEIAAVMNRTFHYTGQFVPVKWKCRAKLPSGKLCERMDRIKVRMMATLTLKTILSAFNSEWTMQAVLMIKTIPSAFISEGTLSTHHKQDSNFGVYCQWPLHNVQITNILFPLTV